MFRRWLKKRDSTVPSAGELVGVPAAKLTHFDGAHSVERQLHAGLTHHQAGRTQEAEQAYQQVLEVEAHNFDALHLLGLLLHQTQRSTQGAALVAFTVTYPEWTRRLRERLQHVFEKPNVPFDPHVVFIPSLPRSEFAV
jgi:hypothetical protein